MYKGNESPEGFRRESRGDRATHAGAPAEEGGGCVCVQEGQRGTE